MRDTSTIAWIDAPFPHGRWGPPDSLTLPLSDRGLQLADGLFETVLVEGGKPLLLAEHLARWRASAELLAMAPPPGAEVVKPLINAAIQRLAGHVQTQDRDVDCRGSLHAPTDPSRRGRRSRQRSNAPPDPAHRDQPVAEGLGAALRLNWSRGHSVGEACRGIALPVSGQPPLQPRFWLQLSLWQPDFNPIDVIISREERRNTYSRLSRCKTFAYGASIQARLEARAAGADDALLLSTTGELCCGTTANLLVRRGERWLTPPLSSGCLPGVMRAQALARGWVLEQRLDPQHLWGSDGALLINSLGCHPVLRCDGRALPPLETGEKLWRALLDPHRSG